MSFTKTQLNELYLAYFGRPADIAGLAFYTGNPANTIQGVADVLSGAAESLGLYGPTFDADAVNAIYRNLFNRDAEPAGLAYWVEEVASGRITAGGAALAIMGGAQNDDLLCVQNKMILSNAFLAQLDTPAEIAGYAGSGSAAFALACLQTVDASPQSLAQALKDLTYQVALATGQLTSAALSVQDLIALYLAYFGRPPDIDGILFYTTGDTHTAASVGAAFGASPESQALYGSTFGAEQLNAIYRNLFNRDAEPDGQTYWLAEVSAGRITAAGAALAILQGAQNEDKATVLNKIAVATAFFGALDTPLERAGYAGDDAAAVARAYIASAGSSDGSLAAAMAQLELQVSIATDTTAPVFDSAVINGSSLVLSYVDEHALDGVHPPLASAFAVSVGGTATGVSAIFVDAGARTVTLTLVHAVTSDDVVTVAYTDPTDASDVHAIQDARGNAATSFGVTVVTNNTPGTGGGDGGPADTTAPVLASAAVDGVTLVLSYAELNLLDAVNAPAASAFAVTAGGLPVTVASVLVDANAKTVTLTLASAVMSWQAVTVAYTDATAGNDANAIQDASGNDAATLSASSVTNNTAPLSVIELSSLDGSNGFRLNGAAAGDHFGFSVSAAGDVNGDGFADLIVGAWRAGPNGAYSGASYVVFGKATGFASEIELSSLDGSNGFRLNGAAAGDRSGFSVSAAGDVNGDGFADLIVGAYGAAAGFGASYVVFGKASDFDSSINLSSLDGSNGFRLNGAAGNDRFGFSVSAAGDVNGDGFADLIVGAYGADPYGKSQAGASYVVFGKASGFASAIELSSLGGSNGFRLNGAAAYDRSGQSVSAAGDVNGDGFADLIVGAWSATPNGAFSGASFVVFGKASGFASAIQLSSLESSNGFRLNGATRDRSGYSVSAAGDVNGDGFADLIVGAYGADPNGAYSGAGYVVFGKASGFDSAIELSGLNGSNGFRLNGVAAYNFSGRSVSAAGDVNGDGFGDLIVGAWGAPYGFNSGASYVVFGKASGFDSAIELSSLDGSSGFRLNGAAEGDRSGYSVSAAGDVNGDGFADLIVGAYRADPNGTSSGASYVVFGGNFTGAVTFLGTDGADVLDAGTAAAERFVAGNGNDSMTGGGGADVFYGGEGDDTIIVLDLDFQRVDGGSGTDTLALSGSGITITLADLRGRLSGIEKIDLTGSGNNTLALTALDVVNLSDTGNTLTVDGNAGDLVQAGGSWAYVGTSGGYRTYTQGEAVLKVSTEVALALSAIELSSLDGSNGFRLNGALAGDFSGLSVSAAGDVNGDGFADLIVGAWGADPNGKTQAGASYVVFGKASGFDSWINLSSLEGSNGFRLNGAMAYDNSGFSVSAAGDVNGDGFADLIVGAFAADPNGKTQAGASYVVFGKASGFASAIELSSLNGTDGFRLNGALAGDLSGRSVSAAGDVNGDGFADLIVGAYGADPYGNTQAGASYVVFGKGSDFASAIELSSLDGINGFRLNGAAQDDRSGFSVSAAGDVNGDGFADLIVGAHGAPNGAYSGASYVVFGKGSAFASAIELSSLDGINGFRLNGAAQDDRFGRSVSAAGDVNGDGFADLIVGAHRAPNGADSGASYVVFGKASGFASTIEVSSLDGSSGFRLDGAEGDYSGISVSEAGDVNGDGFADLIVGAWGAGPNGKTQAGASYVVFGKASGFASAIELSSLDGSNGFRLNGAAEGDYSGSSVSAAGDVNGDGFADLIVGARGVDTNGSFSGASYVVFGGNFTGAVTFLGTSGADVLNAGTAAPERFVAGNGNDSMTGGGGADVFYGGEGDDTIIVSDLDFQLVDGGSGSDTLVLSGSGMSMSLTAARGHLSGIEQIDITGNNTLSLTALDLLNLSDTSNTLTVDGNAGSIVDAGSGWVDGGTSGGYHIYTQGQAVLLVGVDVGLTIIT